MQCGAVRALARAISARPVSSARAPSAARAAAMPQSLAARTARRRRPYVPVWPLFSRRATPGRGTLAGVVARTAPRAQSIDRHVADRRRDLFDALQPRRGADLVAELHGARPPRRRIHRRRSSPPLFVPRAPICGLAAVFCGGLHSGTAHRDRVLRPPGRSEHRLCHRRARRHDDDPSHGDVAAEVTCGAHGRSDAPSRPTGTDGRCAPWARTCCVESLRGRTTAPARTSCPSRAAARRLQPSGRGTAVARGLLDVPP